MKKILYYGLPGFVCIEVEVKENATMDEIKQAALNRVKLEKAVELCPLEE